jgi:hypothetical protein
MENQALFLVADEFPNLRDVLNGQQLQTIGSADLIVAKALKAGMEQKMPYQDIYFLAKERVIEFTDLIGKSIVPVTFLPSPRSTEMIDNQSTLF